MQRNARCETLSNCREHNSMSWQIFADDCTVRVSDRRPAGEGCVALRRGLTRPPERLPRGHGRHGAGKCSALPARSEPHALLPSSLGPHVNEGRDNAELALCPTRSPETSREPLGALAHWSRSSRPPHRPTALPCLACRRTALPSEQARRASKHPPPAS